MRAQLLAVLLGMLAGFGLVGGLDGVSALAQTADDPPLPERLGLVNDYAAALGSSTRETLRTRLERLDAETGVAATVLVTLLDPFDSPERYARAIWNAWGLDAEERAVLLVFVREAQARWAFALRASEVVTEALGPLRSGAAREAIRAALGRRDVAEAVRTGVEALTRVWDLPEEPATSQAPADGPNGEQGAGDTSGSSPDADPGSRGDRRWAMAELGPWALGGLIGLAATVGGGVWALLAWFCPRCGSRLRRRRERAIGRPHRARSQRTRSIQYCPRCGWTRRARRERTRAARRRRAP